MSDEHCVAGNKTRRREGEDGEVQEARDRQTAESGWGEGHTQPPKTALPGSHWKKRRQQRARGWARRRPEQTHPTPRQTHSIHTTEGNDHAPGEREKMKGWCRFFSFEPVFFFFSKTH
jgi:hypothetical protein